MTTMTSIPTEAPRSATEWTRIRNVARLHFTNKWQTIGVPWTIMGAIFIVNLSIWWLVSSLVSSADATGASDGLAYNGSVFYIFVYMLIVAIQAISRTFPFALGFSVTRRDFYLGTSLAFLLLSLVYGAGLTLLSYIEDWSNGWGVNGRMFTASYVGIGPAWQRFFVFAVMFLIFFSIGMASATVYVRWKGNGLLIVGATMLVLLVAAIALTTWTQSWGRVGAWFVDAGTVGVVASLMIPTVIAAVIGYFILRRATPKN